MLDRFIAFLISNNNVDTFIQRNGRLYVKYVNKYYIDVDDTSHALNLYLYTEIKQYYFASVFIFVSRRFNCDFTGYNVRQ